MATDMSEYPDFLKGTPVYSAAEFGMAPRPTPPSKKRSREPEISADDIVLQQQLAANAALASKNGPFSKVGQATLKQAPAEASPPREVENPVSGTNLEPPRASRAHVQEYDEPDPIGDTDSIPASHFLLRSTSGDIFLKPSGFQDEAHFIVLYFEGETLVFRPGLRTKFLGAVDSPSGERARYNLYFSGIAFLLLDVGKTVLIFHKAAS